MGLDTLRTLDLTLNKIEDEDALLPFLKKGGLQTLLLYGNPFLQQGGASNHLAEFVSHRVSHTNSGLLF